MPYSSRGLEMMKTVMIYDPAGPRLIFAVSTNRRADSEMQWVK